MRAARRERMTTGVGKTWIWKMVQPNTRVVTSHLLQARTPTYPMMIRSRMSSWSIVAIIFNCNLYLQFLNQPAEKISPHLCDAQSGTIKGLIFLIGKLVPRRNQKKLIRIPITTSGKPTVDEALHSTLAKVRL